MLCTSLDDSIHSLQQLSGRFIHLRTKVLKRVMYLYQTTKQMVATGYIISNIMKANVTSFINFIFLV
jgi:hypothetical protein